MAINLKELDNQVAEISGRSTTTPITMQGLYDEIQNLKATAKSWEIVTLTRSGSTKNFPFDSKYADWNFIVLSGGTSNFSVNYNTFKAYSSDGWNTLTYTKSGNELVISYTKTPSVNGNITVLFYK